MAQLPAPADNQCTYLVQFERTAAPKQVNSMKPQQINQLADKIESLLPPGIKQIKDDFDEKLKKLLQQQLTKMEFVSREEFDIQSKVLARTREKLESLEKKVEALHNQ